MEIKNPKYFITTCCDEFQKFMLSSSMPKFEINIFDDTQYYLAQATMPLNEGEGYTLDVPRIWHSNSLKEIKTTLFHELTHIYDNFNLLSGFSNDERINRLSLYTEVNATRIQLMYDFNFETINSSKIIKEQASFNVDVILDTIRGEMSELKKQNTVSSISGGNPICSISDCIGYIFGSIIFYIKHYNDGTHNYNKILVQIDDIIKFSTVKIFKKIQEMFIESKTTSDDFEELYKYTKELDLYLLSYFSDYNERTKRIKEIDDEIALLKGTL